MTKTTLVLGVIALGLLAFILLYERHTLTTADLADRQGRVLLEFIRRRVSKVELERAAGRLALSRKAGDEDLEWSDWRVSAPYRADADEQAVDDLLSELEWLQARRTLDSVDEDELAAFGLHKPKVHLSFHVGARRHRVHVGGHERAGQGVYLKRERGGPVYVVDGMLLEELERDALAFHTKSLHPPFSTNLVQELSLRGPQGVLRLARAGEHWRFLSPDGGAAAVEAVEELLRALSALQAARVVELAPLELGTYGLDPPLGQVEVALRKAGPKTAGEADPVQALERRVVLLGNECKGHEAERYIGSGPGRPVFCAGAKLLEKLHPSPAVLRGKRLPQAAR